MASDFDTSLWGGSVMSSQPPVETLFWPRACGAALWLSAAMAMALMGCEERKKVIDVNTPGANIQVDQTKRLDGSTGVEVEIKKK
jgi:hypothetical protein